MNSMLIAVVLLAADWGNLKQITHDRTYAAILLDGTCVSGPITSSNGLQVVLGGKTVRRDDVVGIVTRPGSWPSDAVYSARSSWTDVLAADPSPTEWLRATMKTGKQVNWKEPAASLNKDAVQIVSYIRFSHIRIGKHI